MKLRALLCAAALALASLPAAAATLVSAGNSYDINSDNFFAGNAIDPDGGAGSYAVSFYSLVDPSQGEANASVTLNVLGTFQGLSMSWTDQSGSRVLASAPVVAGITTLRTVFTQPDMTQNLTFTWTGSQAGFGFDFDVAAVPVPAAGLLMLGALGGMGLIASRRRRRQTG